MVEITEYRDILSIEIRANGAGGPYLKEDKKGHLVMNGREVFKFAVKQMPESSVKDIEKIGYEKEDVDYLIPHQANIRIMEAPRKRLDISAHNMATQIKKFGNNRAASIQNAL